MSDYKLINKLEAALSPVLVKQGVFLTVLASLFIASFGIRLSTWVNADVSWYLYATARYVEGAQLYVDIVEVNPPLAFFLIVPPIILSKFTGLAPLIAFYLYVFGLVAAVLYLASRLLIGISDLPEYQRRAFILATAFALLVLPAASFGEREHFLIVLIVPYLLVVARRITRADISLPLAGTAGIVGFLGFALKPHFFLAPVLLELYLLFRNRSLLGVFRPETIGLAVMSVCYAMLVAWQFPHYLNRVVPYAIEVYSGVFGSDLVSVVLLGIQPAILLLLGFAAPKTTTGPRSLAVVFLIGGAAFLIAYLYQMANWHYRIYPALACGFIAISVLVVQQARFMSGLKRLTSFKNAVPALWLFASVVMVIQLSLHAVANLRIDQLSNLAKGQEEKQLLKAIGPAKSLFIFTTGMVDTFPMVNDLNVRWASRFPSLWLLPGTLLAHGHMAYGKPRNKQLIDEIEKYNIDAVVSDLLKHRPEVVIVNLVDMTRDVRTRKDADGKYPQFSYIDYFSIDPRFVEFWKDYKNTQEGNARFAIYRRMNAKSD